MLFVVRLAHLLGYSEHEVYCELVKLQQTISLSMLAAVLIGVSFIWCFIMFQTAGVPSRSDAATVVLGTHWLRLVFLDSLSCPGLLLSCSTRVVFLLIQLGL